MHPWLQMYKLTISHLSIIIYCKMIAIVKYNIQVLDLKYFESIIIHVEVDFWLIFVRFNCCCYVAKLIKNKWQSHMYVFIHTQLWICTWYMRKILYKYIIVIIYFFIIILKTKVEQRYKEKKLFKILISITYPKIIKINENFLCWIIIKIN